MNEFREHIAQRGNLSKLAVALGITPGAISQWQRVPAERVVAVERATGVPREKLRPDLYDRKARREPAE